jgi:hypothetical protein
VGFLTAAVAFSRSRVQRHWPFLLALSIFAATTAILWHLSLSKNGGHFVYTLDDPYIHMAIAKNVVQHGVWGVTPYRFSSSSSSPLWTLILVSSYGLFGVREVIPFLLNLIFAGLSIGLVYSLLCNQMPGFMVFLALLALVFVPPLVPLVFSGMEHTTHLFITLLMVALAAKTLSEDAPSPVLRRGLLVAAFLLTAIRYEGLFLVMVLSILFAFRKRWLYVVSLVGIGLLPLTIYGIWSEAQGWFLLPNPVILKGTSGNQVLFDFFKDVFVRGRPLTWRAIERLVPVLAISRINAHPYILYLMIPSLLLLAYRRGSFWDRANITNAAFIGTALLHMQFANTGWFYRYEAYLVAFGIYAVAIGLGECLPWRNDWKGWGNRLFRIGAVLLLLILVSAPLRVRAVKSIKDTPKASYNIYEQQYQMAYFLREFYQGQVVAANDIGLIDYLAELRLVDLAGLGTPESAALKLKHQFGAQQVAAVADQYHTQIALVYDSWFRIPSSWMKVGEWQIRDNVVCGDSTVSFYAINPTAAPGLMEALQAYAPRLPGDVIQRGDFR